MRRMLQITLWALAATITTACQRRPIGGECLGTAQIPVQIDWSESGISPASGLPSDYVHRVSLRFFPDDGSTPFDRYLESNVFEGKITLPVGSYSVVVFNEAVDDLFWNEVLYFTDVNNYHLFAANLVGADPTPYRLFFTPKAGELFSVEPFKLASWSLDRFVITPQMVARPPHQQPDIDPNDPINALTHIVMRRLVAQVRVTANVKNLNSAAGMRGAVQGLANRVYMASAATEQRPSTYLFALQAPIWSSGEQVDGSVTKTFRSFGRLPNPSEYTLMLSTILVNGELYPSTEPLRFDVTDQVLLAPADLIEIQVGFELPHVTGEIGVGGWDNEDITIQ